MTPTPVEKVGGRDDLKSSLRENTGTGGIEDFGKPIDEGSTTTNFETTKILWRET